jgi:hypothetical protein
MLEAITKAVKQKFFPILKPSISPSSLDLSRHFEKFVDYWAAAKYEYLGPIQGGLSDLPVEVSVRWKGTIGGRIVIRCRPEFLNWLQESRDDKPAHMRTENEIFHEMSSLYSVYLIFCFWMSDFSEMGMIQPRSSTPADWPSAEPTATCGLLVQDNPVEIRLWVGAASF